ncbi:MAG TPA: flagellar basal body-associated FliL family protein [Gemmatimonadaceae bacterium]
MATQAIDQAPVAEGEATQAAPAGKGKVMMFAAIGLVAGLAAGLFGVGPILAKNKASHPAIEKKAEKGEGGEGAGTVSHAVDNLVLNPAGSNGTRFLMVTATFEMKDAAADQLMKDHEAEVRDVILGLLGKKTIDELTDIGKRDGVKKEVLDAVSPVFPKGAVLKVFFPQFVVQ